MKGDSGQGAVEALGAMWIAAALIAGFCLLALILAFQLMAGAAAEAGGVALLEGLSPAREARMAVPPLARKGMSVKVRGQEVTVSLTPFDLPVAVGRVVSGHARIQVGGR